MKNKWYTYLIRCEDGSFYVGHTSDLDRRFKEHSQGKGGRYTNLHRPIEILYHEEFSTEKESMDRERQIKGWRREKKENLFKIKN